jgi:hypothetical protein
MSVKQAVLKKEPEKLPEQLPQQASEASALIAMIERAARDQAVDIDKMERLMGMVDRVREREARIAFDVALAAMQPELPVIEKRGRIAGESKRTGEMLRQTFGRWEDIAPAIAPVLSKHGFGVRFEQEQVTDVTGAAKTRITCVLSHGGHRERAHFDLPLDTTGSKNNVQAYGSTASYGKRYSAMLALNIITRDEDDDGSSAGSGELVNDEEMQELSALMTKAKANTELFLKYLQIKSLAELPKARLKAAKDALHEKLKATAK